MEFMKKSINTVQTCLTKMESRCEKNAIKLPDYFLALFLTTYILTRIIPMPSMLANMFAAATGLLCFVYVWLSDVKVPRRGCAAVCLVFCVSLIASLIHNSNASIYYVLWVWGFMGVALLLYGCRLNPKFILNQFYAFSAVLMLYAALGLPAADFLSIGSENNISTYLLLYLLVYLLSRRYSTAPIPLIPIAVAILPTMWTGCRGGLLALGILAILAFLYNLHIPSERRKYTRVLNKVKNTRWLLITVGVVFVIAVVLVLKSSMFKQLIWKFTNYGGGSSARQMIWGEYFISTSKSIANILLGPDMSNTDYLYLSWYQGNPHNAFLSLHAHFGVLPVLMIVITMFYGIYRSIRRRRYILAIVLVSAFARSFLDWTAFPGPYDVIFYFAVLVWLDRYPVSGGVGHAAMHYTQTAAEVTISYEKLGGLTVKLVSVLKRMYSWCAFHVYDLLSPKKMTEIKTIFDTTTMTKCHHMVTALRYVAIENYYGKNDFGRELYIHANNWENDAALKKDLEKFDALIQSIEKRGYDNNSAIYVDLDGNCINGTHRLALCAWFGIKEIPVVQIPRHLKPTTVEQLAVNFKLTEEEYQQLEEAYSKMYASFQ